MPLWRQPHDRGKTRSEALEALQEAEAELARLREALARAEAQKEALERETLRLQLEAARLRENAGALEAELDALKAEVEQARAHTLDLVARALANKPGPSFAQDETGAWVASFPRGGGQVAAFRIAENESRRNFKWRVWRAWLDHQLGKG